MSTRFLPPVKLQKGSIEETRVFYANMCFICEKTVKEIPLKRCGSCRLISYCGQAHQKYHWKYHSRLCKLINLIEKLWTPAKIDDDISWYRYRTNLLLLCEVKLEKTLKPYEISMILFPNNCDVCHTRNNLKPCMGCLCVNYCSEEHRQVGFAKHRPHCAAFNLNFEIDLKLERSMFFPTYQVKGCLFRLTDCIERFIEENIEIAGDGYTPAMELALISDFLTCPLTVLYALSLTYFQFKKTVVIHVVGCSYLETASLEAWKTILHVYPTINKLIIHFIGPEVCRNTVRNLCNICKDKTKFYFFPKFYHEYVKSTDYIKPDVIAAFNCGFHEYQHSSGDCWKDALPFLVKDPNVPLIFTAFTEREARDDSVLLLKTKKHISMRTVKNRFCSKRPYRDLETSAVYYNNQYLGIIYSKIIMF